MFGWLAPTPRCPVDTYEKAWTETRMMWLAERFGKERLLSATVVLPDARFFPERYEGTAQDAARLFGRMRDYMGVGPDSRVANWNLTGSLSWPTPWKKPAPPTPSSRTSVRPAPTFAAAGPST
jgi:hypothetical protein